MLTSSARAKSADATPKRDSVPRCLKTLLPRASSTSNVTGDPASGCRVAASKASARRCMVWPGWYSGLSDDSMICTDSASVSGCVTVSSPSGDSTSTRSVYAPGLIFGAANAASTVPSAVGSPEKSA